MVNDLLFKRNQEHVLPFPSLILIFKTLRGLIKEYKGQVTLTTTRIPKAKQLRLNEIDKLIEEIIKLKVHIIT